MGRFSVELVVDGRAALGECPVWDDRRERLLWIDMPRGEVHSVDVSSGDDDVVAVGQPVGSISCRRTDGLVIALRDGFGLLEHGEDRVRLVAPVEHDVPGNQMNDGACDPRGRFLAGTASTLRLPESGTLYRLDPDYGVTSLIDGVGMSNGIGWSPDGARLYYVDSTARHIDVYGYDVDVGRPVDRRGALAIDPLQGIPDGLAVDADGCVWVALWGAGKVARCTPDGRLDAVVTVPVSQVTSCAFGGPALDELYITTAATGLGSEQRSAEPLAGGVFRASPRVTGLPLTRFAG